MYYPIIGADFLVYAADPATGAGLWSLSLTTLQQVYWDDTATVTYHVEDAAGVPLLGETWPQVATYVEDSDGQFTVLLRSSIAFVPHVECTLVIDAQNGPDAKRQFREPLHPRPPEETQ